MKLGLSRHGAVVASVTLLGCVLSVAGCDNGSTSDTAEASNASAVEAQEPVDAGAANVGDEGAAVTEEGGDVPGAAANPGVTNKNPEAANSGETPVRESVASTEKTRETLDGWWQILFSTPSGEDGLVHDISAGFLKIGKTDDGHAVTETRFNNVISPAELTRESSVAEDDVRLFFQYEDLRFDYAGQLAADGVIRGNLQFEGTRQNMVRLVPVAEESVPEEAPDAEVIGATAQAESIRDALSAENPVEALKAGGEKWHGSPALFFAYIELLERLGTLQLDEAATKDLVNHFLEEAAAWGERAVARGKIIAGIALISSGDYLSFGQELIGQARNEAPELTSYWDAELAYVEELASIESAWQQAAAGDEEGLKTLRELYEAGMPSQHLTYRLAQAEREIGSRERAERLFAEAAIFPWGSMGLMMLSQKDDFVPPAEVVAAMYEERTGGREGLDSYLDEVYHEEVAGFVPDEERNRAATESKRVVLLELFTGATCPPCVAADVGTEAIEKSFPREDAVVLRYHLHIPGPDPLATADTEARQEYYSSDILGTPTLLVNGEKPIFPIGGPYGRSLAAYQGMSGLLSEKVTEPTTATLDVAATVEGDALHITANGSAGEKPFDTVKLRIVVAENNIDFAAPNGIKHHSMVVRGMPGGAEGIASDEGKFSFDETVSLVEMRQGINDYLDSFESQVGRPFAVRPSDFRNLTVVAFLQDDVTHEILQAAAVPIGEEIVLPSADAAEGPEGNAPEDEENASAGGPALGVPGE